MPDPERRFVIGDGFDFAVGWYRLAYSPRKSRRGSDTDRTAAIRDVHHQRCIFCVKGKYAIICDRVLGKGRHQIDILFHLAPVVMGEDKGRTAQAVELEIMPNGMVVTKESRHTNVAIVPAQDQSLKVLDLIGRKDPVRGWFALYGIQPSHDIVYRCNPELPEHFETVVQPLPAGTSEPLKVQSQQVNSKDGKTCAAVKCGNDLFLISYDGQAEMTCEGIKFIGTALLLKFDKSGRTARAYMVDVELLTVGGREIFSTDTQKLAVSLIK